ncbi:MAG: hypothetical protein JSU74_10165 [Candidatus Zixiibacteriota bacterium]|nr:MAG: hypothetical protein JSU74_10165 [candidate division Zixibacteria bacterium]
MIKRDHLRGLTLLVFIFLVVASRLGAETGEDWAPVYNPTLHAQPAEGNISIDGDLSDPGWLRAAKADNFAEHQPGDQTRPPVNTEALITYDSDKLYVAFICYDDPATIRASLCERDRIWQDDNICLLIDTYGDAAWALRAQSESVRDTGRPALVKKLRGGQRL